MKAHVPVVIGSLLAAYALVAALPASRPFAPLVGTLALILGCLGAAWSAFAAYRQGHADRHGWLGLGITFFVSALGWASVTVEVAATGTIPTSPTWLDGFFLTAYVTGTVAILLLVSTRGLRAPAVTLLLDGVIVACSLLLVGWATLQRLGYTVQSLGDARLATGLAYPAGDIVILTALLLLASRTRGLTGGPLPVLALSVVSLAGADLLLFYLGVLAPGSDQTAPTVLLLAATLFMAVAAKRAESSPVQPLMESGRERRWLLLPYAGLLFALLVVVPRLAITGRVDGVTMVCGVSVVVAISIRQLVALLENQRLNDRLSRAADAQAKAAGAALALEQQHRQLLDALVEAVLLVEPDGRIAWANAAANALFGPARVRPNESRADGLFASIQDVPPAVETDAGPWRGESVARDANGIDFPAGVMVLGLDGDVAASGRRVLILRNVADEKRAQAQLEAQLRSEAELERLQDMNRFKATFLNTAAHELGTPLTPIRIQLHLLQKAGFEDAAAAARSVSMIGRNVDRLSDLVRDILDASRIQSSRIALRPQPVDLALLVRETTESYRVVADEAGLVLSVDAAPMDPVVCDPARIAQVLLNLLSNAAKFTPAGGHIRVRLEARGEGARVSVADDGAGLSQDQLALLFRPFTQVHAPDPRRGGTGLGLYISRGIIEASGGHIGCESLGPGRGTTFYFELPFEAKRTGPDARLEPTGGSGSRALSTGFFEAGAVHQA